MSRGFSRSLAMLMAGLLSLAAGIAVAAPVRSPVIAPEHRVALVIGNASYAHVPGLKNPANDATAIAKAIARAAVAANRYPDPSAGLLRRRIAERYEVDPAGVALANGSW